MNDFHKLIKEICNEEKIKYSILSKEWVIMLEKDNKTKFISGYKFDLNKHGLGTIIDDKYAMFEVLSKKNIPTIEHKIIFKKDNKNEYAIDSNNYDIVYKYFKENNNDIVIKANDSTCGNEVYHITDINDILDCLNKLFIKNFSISICPFYNIKTEYRLIVLNNKCVLMYGKKRPIVNGDGKSTIRELLLKFNPYYFKDKLDNEKYSKILNTDEKYEYNWQFNLSKGSIPFQINDKNLENKLLNLLEEITSKINLGFCSVDIIETTDNELLIMELNSGVMMKNYCNLIKNGYDIAKEIYKEAIIEMFK